MPDPYRLLHGVYETAVDRESAAEKLQAGAAARVAGTAPASASSSGAARPLPGDAPVGQPAASGGGLMGALGTMLFGSTGPRGGKREGLLEMMTKTAARSATHHVMRELLGEMFGGRKR